MRKINIPLDTKYYRGVVALPGRSKPYRVRIKVRQRDITIGYFETPEEAAKAYNEAAIKAFGENAVLNKLDA